MTDRGNNNSTSNMPTTPQSMSSRAARRWSRPKNQETISPWVLPQYQLLQGCMPIVGKEILANMHDIVRQYIVILNGDYKGEVWMVDDTTIERIYSTEIPIKALTIMEVIAYGGV